MSGLYRQLCADPELPRPAKHPYGAGQVFESEPVRLEHRDLVDFAPPQSRPKASSTASTAMAMSRRSLTSASRSNTDITRSLAYET